MSDNTVRSGGCQCGAVRFHVRGDLGRPTLCHCRMCQKHFGGPFSVLVIVPDGVDWTRESPSFFQSSVNIERGFCARCGTPLFFRSPDGIELAVGAFDDRSDLAPQVQVHHADRLPWVDTLFNLPVRDASKDAAQQEGIISFQHPDHDTKIWPAHGLHL